MKNKPSEWECPNEIITRTQTEDLKSCIPITFNLSEHS